MNTSNDSHLCLPSKSDLLQRLRSDGFNFGAVLDVGVMKSTPELMEHFRDVPQLLCEPVEEFHSAIRDTYSAAGVDFILEPRAVSSSTGTSELEIVSAPGGEGITHSTLAGAHAASEDRRTIQTVTLDASVAEHQMKAPYLLKVDVDGFELAVLEGAPSTLSQTAVLVIEATFHRFSEIDAFMTAQGFKVYDVIDLCYSDGKFWQCDLVYYNPDLARQIGVERKDYVEDLSRYQGYIPEAYVNAPVVTVEPQVTLDHARLVELENYRLLVPAKIRHLAKSGALIDPDWKVAAQSKPTDVTSWRALRRASKRLARKDKNRIFEPPVAAETEPQVESDNGAEEELFGQNDVRVCTLITRLGIGVDAIADVGAANGAWSEQIRYVFPGATFDLFEPLAGHVDIYRDEHARRKAAGETYTLHQMALSDEDGEAEIELHDNQYSSSLLSHDSNQDFPKIKVRVARLDSLLEQGKIPQPDILKMDTQGAELKILRGATQLLKRTKFVVAETWLKRDYGPETPLLSEMIAFMAEHNFQPFDYGDPWRQDWDGRLGALDIWFANTSIEELGLLK